MCCKTPLKYLLKIVSQPHTARPISFEHGKARMRDAAAKKLHRVKKNLSHAGRAFSCTNAFLVLDRPQLVACEGFNGFGCEIRFNSGGTFSPIY